MKLWVSLVLTLAVLMVNGSHGYGKNLADRELKELKGHRTLGFRNLADRNRGVRTLGFRTLGARKLADRNRGVRTLGYKGKNKDMPTKPAERGVRKPAERGVRDEKMIREPVKLAVKGI